MQYVHGVPYAHFNVPCEGGEPEKRLNAFLCQHAILKVEQSLVSGAGAVFWAYAVHYDDAGESRPGRTEVPREERVDYRDLLSEDAFALYVKLKEWRRVRAEKEALPPFAVFTNAVLSDIAQEKPGSLSALQKVRGVGEKKAEKYGEDVLKVIQPPSPEGAQS